VVRRQKMTLMVEDGDLVRPLHTWCWCELSWSCSQFCSLLVHVWDVLLLLAGHAPILMLDMYAPLLLNLFLQTNTRKVELLLKYFAV
jgi:hypothetical protein